MTAEMFYFIVAVSMAVIAGCVLVAAISDSVNL